MKTVKIISSPSLITVLKLNFALLRMWKLKKQQNLPREFHHIAHALYYLYRKFSTGAGVCDVNQSTVKGAEWLWSFLDYCYVMEKRNCSKTIEGKVKFKS